MGAGHSLRELVLVEERPQYSSDGPWNKLLPGSHWARFDALERLDWGFRQTRLASDGHEYLPNLKFLRIRYAHESFLDVESTGARARGSLGGAESLFKKHGKKLKYLSAYLGLRQSDVLECPALETLELRQEVQPAVLCNVKHSNIRQIKLNWATLPSVSS
ncbi:hypothetical protein EXIGLDRAFT_767378 [Exidia glandulosa HHB12029]|uniref:Uncharacterized protein n=1 Tax=Exidia glandulosa HHB12029 TaxID=1314781 RepID=A0A165J1Y8_EXIGL|nr:hypothetical protein EXIGLDRAFT_767378 [Exidia glandulosa HHB12029]